MRSSYLIAALSIVAATLFTSCNRLRDLASDGQTELPPVKYTGVASTAKDQPPLVNTGQGFAVQNLPGITPPPATPLEYTEYIGPSN